MDKSDRREMERFDFKLPARIFWTTKDKEKESIELLTINVCAGGAYLMTNSPLPVGKQVKINLTLHLDRLHELRPRLLIVDVSGYVIRTDHQGMAIRFDRKHKILPQ